MSPLQSELHFCNKIFCVQGSIYSLFLYDAVYLYMTMMDQIVSEGLDWRNGTFWRNRARNWVTTGEFICHAVKVNKHDDDSDDDNALS